MDYVEKLQPAYEWYSFDLVDNIMLAIYQLHRIRYFAPKRQLMRIKKCMSASPSIANINVVNIEIIIKIVYVKTTLYKCQ